VSNNKGEFSITVPNGATIIVSHVGYTVQQIVVKNQTAINIVLEEEKNELSQVVVIGYGSV
jgi:hypothetical protein